MLKQYENAIDNIEIVSERETVIVIGKAFGFEVATQGEGTENSPYLITNKDQLEFLVYLVNNGNTFEGKHIKLENNITLDSTRQWTPIGNNTNRFEGIFDGDGKIISGLNINNSLSQQGFFGVLGEKGVVQKIIVEGNCSFLGESGCIVGVNRGIIRNCENRATINQTSKTAYCAGGICGNNIGTIYGCINSGTCQFYEDTGGIVGGNSGVVKECYNIGAVSSSNACSGGIVGSNNGKVFNCYNKGSVTGSYSGGIIGIAGYGGTTSYVYNCYTTNNTTVAGYPFTIDHKNNYTTNANTKLTELNAGIDEVGETTNTESPWIADDTTNPINGGYPILSWQKTN